MLDLGADGLVAIAAVSTLNLGLHTPAEQDALLAGYARYLHTLTGPVQFLIRTVPVDLDGHLHALHEQARTLPHPALVTAALGHRAHLARLATPGRDAADGDGLTARQVLLVLREPAGGSGGQRLARRLEDAIRILASLDITVTPLDAAQISALLTDCANPDHPAAHPYREQSHGAAPMTPVGDHPPPPTARPPAARARRRASWRSFPGPRPDTAPARCGGSRDRLPRVPTHPGPVDFTLADDVDDDRDDPLPDTDRRLLRHRRARRGRRLVRRPRPPRPSRRIEGRGGDIVGGPDGDFDLDEFDPGAAAARWWGR